ncbi:MAG: hypothetical protein ACP5G0_04150, partial [Desulfomonilia bacterium]
SGHDPKMTILVASFRNLTQVIASECGRVISLTDLHPPRTYETLASDLKFTSGIAARVAEINLKKLGAAFLERDQDNGSF